MLEFLSEPLIFLFLILPLASGIRLVFKQQKAVKPWVISWLMVSVICYILFVMVIGQENQRIEDELYAFDLNGDREFSEAEMTPEAEEAMRRYANDTGRSFAPIAGLIFCPIYSGFVHFIMGIAYFAFQCIRERRAEYSKR